MQQVILDTGPLVALFHAQDTYHQWVSEQFKLVQMPLLTCESVISETCFLLQRVDPLKVKQIFVLLDKSVIQISFDFSKEHRLIQALMEKYTNVPMSIADACLVRMSELFDNAKVFTLDSDFDIYRKNRNEAIPCIIPLER